MDERANKQYIITAFSLFLNGAAILGFANGVGEVLPTSDVRNLISGTFQLKFQTGNSEIPTSQFH